MEYQRTKSGTIYAEVPVSDIGKIRIIARNIRRDRAGVHANVGIWWDDNPLEYDNFSIERNEERRKLAYGSWNLLPEDERGVRNWMPRDTLKAELDMFCDGLWDAHVGRITVDQMRPEKFRQRRMIGPYIVEEGGTILFGPPGGGKSTVTYLIGQSLNSGSSKVWEVREKHRPLLINLERSPLDVNSKLWGINQALGIDDSVPPLDVVNARGYSLRDVEGAARRHIEKHGNDVVLLDSISRVGGGGSMKDDDVANAAMDLLNSLCPTWLAIAHEAKGGTDLASGEKRQSTTFGSQMYRAACDLEVRLTSEQPSMSRMIVDLQVTKKNIPLVQLHETLYLEMGREGLAEVLRPESWGRYRKTG